MAVPKKLDDFNGENPHGDDPRFVNKLDQIINCKSRFEMFCRCARELGEEHTRCKYQYYRAECVCPGYILDEWQDHRARGTLGMDVLPDRKGIHIRQ